MSSRQFINRLAAFALAAFFSAPALCLADPGDLDTSFLGTGILLDNINGSTQSEAADMLLQPDGKIVVTGTRDDRVFVVRYNPDGSRDAGFGGNGLVLDGLFTPIGAVGAESSSGKRLALQPDGKILFAGSIKLPGFDETAFVARLDPDGRIEEEFGTAGGVVLASDLFPSFATSLALQNDGKILVGSDDDGGTDSCLVRLDSSGLPDFTFSVDGQNNTIIFNGRFAQGIEGIVEQDDGKLLFFGQGSGHAVLGRVNANAGTDNTFGGDGFVDFLTNDGNNLNAIAQQSDGKLVVVGLEKFANSDFLIARLNSDGSLDGSFSGDGFATVSFTGQNDIAERVFISDIGMVFASGSIDLNARMGVAKFNPDGTPDITYGNAGKAEIDFPGSSAQNSGLALDTNGRAIVSGTVEDELGAARLEGNTADLSIQKTASDDSVDLGDRITYQIVVTNLGPDPSGNAIVTDVLDPALSFESATSTQGNCSGTDTLICELGSIANGAQITITLTVTANDFGDIVNTAVVEAGQITDDATNNSSSVTVIVSANGGGGCGLNAGDSPKVWPWGAALTVLGLIAAGRLRRLTQ